MISCKSYSKKGLNSLRLSTDKTTHKNVAVFQWILYSFILISLRNKDIFELLGGYRRGLCSHLAFLILVLVYRIVSNLIAFMRFSYSRMHCSPLTSIDFHAVFCPINFCLLLFSDFCFCSLTLILFYDFFRNFIVGITSFSLKG